MEAQTRILVVDDDPAIRTLLQDYLRSAGYLCETAGDGVKMRAALETYQISLIVLDINLPGQDGLALCRDLRAKSSLPVIMLTARGEAIDRILGLEMGADDYLAKPFEPRELVARIRNVLKRHGGSEVGEQIQARLARFNGWTLDLERRLLIDRDNRVVMLSGADFRFLKAFIEQPNRVVSRDVLAVAGHMRDPNDRSVDLQVSRLRAKLKDDARAPRLIKTARSEGYVLACPVEFEL